MDSKKKWEVPAMNKSMSSKRVTFRWTFVTVPVRLVGTLEFFFLK